MFNAQTARERIYLAGWYDRYVRDETILFNNLNQLDQPQRLSIGPWTHTTPTLTVWRQPGRMSWVDLPVIPPS